MDPGKKWTSGNSPSYWAEWEGSQLRDREFLTLNQPYSFKIADGVSGNPTGPIITNQSNFSTIGFAADSFSVTGDGTGAIFVNFTPIVPVPEPAMVLGIAVAALGFGAAARKRRARHFFAGTSMVRLLSPASTVKSCGS